MEKYNEWDGEKIKYRMHLVAGRRKCSVLYYTVNIWGGLILRSTAVCILGIMYHLESVESDAVASGSRLGGGGVLICCLPSVFFPLTTHPFRDEAQFPLLIETPPTFGRSPYVVSLYYLRNFLLILSPSCLAACGHHQSPRIAIVFSQKYLVCQPPACRIRLFPPSPPLNTCRSSLHTSHSPTT